MPSLPDQLKALPNKPGVYLFKDQKGVILYVGKARRLRQRVASYFKRPQEIKTALLLEKLRDIDYLTTASEMDALLLENELIKEYRPRYNIALRDDKTYPYLKLTVKEYWPRLFLARKKERDGALYFGRFQGGMVREAVRLVKKLFPIRWCKESPLRQREQPCLYYRIGSCAGPCVGKISRSSYRGLVEAVARFLAGDLSAAAGRLEQEMAGASREQDFERAAYLRDRLKVLRKMMEGKRLERSPSPRRLTELAELRSRLGLAAWPMRIEAFDISNLQSQEIVGSLVVFYGGLPLKTDYRRFKIKGLPGKHNDVAAIHEVVKRRFTASLAARLPRPDLVLVDGGLPQVNAAAAALKDAGIRELPLIGLAKKEELIFRPQRGRPLALPKTSAALQLLQRVRDEAHRFAVTFHRARRSKSLFGR